MANMHVLIIYSNIMEIARVIEVFCDILYLDVTQTEYCVHNVYYRSNLAKLVYARIGTIQHLWNNGKDFAITFLYLL